MMVPAAGVPSSPDAIVSALHSQFGDTRFMIVSDSGCVPFVVAASGSRLDIHQTLAMLRRIADAIAAELAGSGG